MAVVIVVDDWYLLQLRHNKQGIFFPNHWGCFGGRLEPSESAEAALCWELDEDSISGSIRPGFPKPSVIWSCASGSSAWSSSAIAAW